MVIQLTSEPYSYGEDMPTYDAIIDGHKDQLVKQHEDGKYWMSEFSHGSLKYVPVPEDAVVLPYDRDTSYIDTFSTDFLDDHGVEHDQAFLLVGETEAHVFHPEDEDGLDANLADAFWSKKDGYADIMGKYKRGEPVVELTMLSKAHPDGQSFLLIPESDAELAYENPEYHDKIAKHMNRSDIVEFLQDAHALSFVRDDPLSAGLVDGAVWACQQTGGTDPHSGWMEKNVAERLQTFRKDERFDAFMDDLIECGTIASLTEEPFEAASGLSFEVPDYIAGMNRKKETPLSRGIEEALHEKNYEKLHEKLDGFFAGERKTIRALKEVGKALIEKEHQKSNTASR